LHEFNMSDAYARLLTKLKRAHYLGTVVGLLGWDEQVNLPPDSADQRAEQLALLAELQHAAASDPEIGEILAKLENRVCHLLSDKLSGVDDEKAVIREVKKDYERVVKLPAEFVAEKARLSSAAYHGWAAAKGADDFAAFAPFLERHLKMAKQEAAYLGWGDRPYDYAINKHDPGMDTATITALFAELKAGLLPLVRAIAASPVRARTGIFNGFPVDAQCGFLRRNWVSITGAGVSMFHYTRSARAQVRIFV
jgi:carboxypeptidase Taq